MTHPKSALIKQYVALLEAEGVKLEFEKSSIKAISELATEVNTKTENIGARRLHTIMTTLLEKPLFEQPKRGEKKIKITAKIVKESLDGILEDQDLILLAFKKTSITTKKNEHTTIGSSMFFFFCVFLRA